MDKWSKMNLGLCLTLVVAFLLQAAAHTCLDTGCGGEGICIDLGNNNFKCSCFNGLVGNATHCIPSSGTYLTGCHYDPCIDGTCVDQLDGTSKCVCKPGNVLDPKNDKLCVPEVMNCPNKPCQDGTCKVAADWSRSCVCREGFVISATDLTVCVASTGSRVEDCRTTGCTYGVCSGMGSFYECQCIQGYRLSATNKTLCEPAGGRPYDPCYQFYCTYGQCVPDAYGFGRCQCYPGFRLSRENPLLCKRIYIPPPRPTCASFPCENGQCVQNPNGNRYCRCYDGFELDTYYPQRCNPKPKTNNWNNFWQFLLAMEEM